MSLLEHLGEIRRRLMRVVGVTVVAMIAGLYAAKPLLNYFKQAKPASGIEWNAFAPWDGLRVYIQVAFLLAVVVVGPFALYQLWSFAKPGLKLPERQAALRYIPYTFLLFLAGLSFAYFIVFPLAFRFTTSFNGSLGLMDVYGVAQYFSFMFNILLPLSLMFQMPVVVMFLTRLRLLNPERLRKMRRYAYMAQLVAATLVTPPDVVSVLLVAVPLVGLYEMSVFLSGVIVRKQRQMDNEQQYSATERRDSDGNGRQDQPAVG